MVMRVALPCLELLGLAVAKQAIWLTSIQPYTGEEWDGGMSITVGGKLMLEEVNAHSSLLRDYELKIVWQDGMCSKAEGTRIFYQNVFEKKYFAHLPNESISVGDLDVDGDGLIEKEEVVPFTEEWGEEEVSPTPIGLLGSGCSGTAINIAKIAYFTKVHMVSNSATRPGLSNREEFPNFFRTIMPDTKFNGAWVSIAKMLGQSSLVAVIGETENWGSMGQRMALEAQAAGVTLVGQDLTEDMPGFYGLQASLNSQAMAADVAASLVQLKQRVIILMMFGPRNRLVMCEAYKLGLRNAVFMPMGWLPGGWWAAEDTSCTPQQLTLMARGFISANMMFWRSDSDARLSCSETMTAGSFQEEWFRRQGAEVGEYGWRPEGFFITSEAATTADAVCMYAQALDKLLVEQNFSFEELVARTPRAYEELNDLLQATDFEGVQGRLTYEPGSADPEGSVILQQLQVEADGNVKVVDIASFRGGVFNFLGKADLVFGLPGETVFAGPSGATSITLDLVNYETCTGKQVLDMETNVCQDCPEGRVFLDIVSDCVCRAGFATVGDTCVTCGPGTFTGRNGKTQCDSCPAGRFESGERSTECTRCAVGNFTQEPGQSVCRSCEVEMGPSFTTEFPGVTSKSDCQCGEGFYRDATSRECRVCPRGMECPFGSDMQENSTVKPKLLPAHWSDPQEPLSVYRCDSADRCPGGGFGACADNTESRSCSHCSEGWTWTGDRCAGCTTSQMSWLVFPVLPILIAPVVACFLYKMFGDTYERWGSWQNGVAAMIFILLNYVQMVALMKSVELNLPATVVQVFETTSIINDVIRIFTPECNGHTSFQSKQLMGVLAPAAVLLIVFATWLGSQCLARLIAKEWLAMEPDRTKNVAMSLIYTFFTSIVTISCTLFKCGPNPNGTWSLIGDRSVICYEDEWFSLLAVGVIGIFTWCFCVVALFSRAVFYTGEQYFHDRGVQMRWKFLFIKYRPDVHWWSLVFMARAVVLNLGIIILRQSMSQLYFVMAILMVYLALLSVCRPWRHKYNNLADGLTQLGLILICSVLTRFVDSANELDVALSRASVVVVLVCLVLSLTLGAAMVYVQLSPHVRDKAQEELSEIVGACQRLGGAEPEDVRGFLEALGEWDLWHMTTAKNIIMTEFCRVSMRSGLSTQRLSERNSLTSGLRFPSRNSGNAPGSKQSGNSPGHLNILEV